MKKMLYEKTNVKQLAIDNLPLRKNAPSYTIYYDNIQRNIKRCKICVDSWDNAKILSSMVHLHKAKKEQTCEYYIDVKNGVVRKLKEHIRYCTNHNIKLVLNEDNYYKGSKSMALKKLDRELKKAQ